MRSSALEYRRVYTALKSGIERGEYPVGTMLPPEPKLASMFSVSRTTIRKAIGMLVSDRYITVQQGRGTEVISDRAYRVPERGVRFHNVRDISERVLTSAETKYRWSPASVSICPASEQVAGALEVALGDPVYRVQRMSYLGEEQPFIYKVNYLRPDAVGQLEQFDGMSFDLYLVLAEEYGIFFDHGDETITAVVADFIDAQLFKVKVGAPLLLFCRYAYTTDKPMEYAEVKLLPEYYELRVHMRGLPEHVQEWVDSQPRSGST